MRGRGGSAAAVLLLVALLGAALAGCSSDGAAAERPPTSAALDRGATEDSVPSDWDIVFTVSIVNRSNAPIEVGISADPAPGGDKEQYVGSNTPGIDWQTAGSGRTLVVPPGSATTAKQLDILVKQKLGRTPRTTNTTGRPDPVTAIHDLLIALPTMQLRFKSSYMWDSDCKQQATFAPPYVQLECANTRIGTAGLQTRNALGAPTSYEDLATCLNPISIKDVKTVIPDTSQVWTALRAASFDQMTLDVAAPSSLTTDSCSGDDVQVHAPAMSFSDGSPTPVAYEGKRLGQSYLPGTDLRGADLLGVQLSGLPRTNLAYADLRGANLVGTNFSNADLTGTRFDGAVVDASTTWDDALLFDTDLSKVVDSDGKPSVIPWSKFSTAILCRTKLPQSTLDDYAKTIGGTPEVDQGCKEALTAHLDEVPAAGAIVTTASAVPLTLVTQRGTFDCPLPSTVGSFSTIAPTSACSATYGSSRLVVPPGVAGAQPHGSVDLSSTGPSNPVAGLAIARTAPAGGWTGIICPAALPGVATDGCPSGYVPLPTG